MAEQTDTILIVDDNPTNLRVLVEYLHDRGFKTLVATSGERALLQLERHTPDLILLDVMMPGIDGFETCRRLKMDVRTADIPVIFMTALNDTEHKVTGFKAGAVDYVTKPFQQEEVSARINTHLIVQRQKRELRDLNETKDKFFSVIGHDLRGPFTVLLGFSEIFADPERDLTPQQRQRFGSLIHQSARNAYNLLENLLDWARLQRGSIDYDPIPLSLEKSTIETISLLTHSAGIKNIALFHTIDPSLFVLADPNMLSTVLRNLMSNAIKFTGSGGTVQVTARQENGHAQVVISDTGVGMSPEQLARVMANDAPLSTTGTRGEHGTGLGLLLCREFVVRLGGELRVESKEGEGSTFSFTLPLPPRPVTSGIETAPDVKQEPVSG